MKSIPIRLISQALPIQPRDWIGQPQPLYGSPSIPFNNLSQILPILAVPIVLIVGYIIYNKRKREKKK